MIDFLKELEESFRGNGVDISGMPGEVTIEDGKLFISKHMALDFSEHDKKVAEEKDKRIAELTEELWKINEDFKQSESENTALRAENEQLYERINDLEFGDNQRIEELEKENAKLEKTIQSMRATHILLRQRCKGEAVEFFDRNMFGSLIISSPPLEDSKRISELEDRHQSDCIRINQLLATIDVLTERYQKLREVHGL